MYISDFVKKWNKTLAKVKFVSVREQLERLLGLFLHSVTETLTTRSLCNASFSIITVDNRVLQNPPLQRTFELGENQGGGSSERRHGV